MNTHYANIAGHTAGLLPAGNVVCVTALPLPQKLAVRSSSVGGSGQYCTPKELI